MNEFLKMDIFFVIASVAAVVLVILLAILIYYLILFMRDLKYISGKARAEADNLSEDLGALRKNIREQGFKIKHGIEFIQNIFNRKSNKRK